MAIIERGIGESIRVGDLVHMRILSIEDEQSIRLELTASPALPVWIEDAPPEERMVIDNLLRVLLVEDDPVHARLFKTALSRCREVQVSVAGSVGAAVARLGCTGTMENDGADRIDLILLDLELPDGTAVDVLRAVRSAEHVRRTPVVILSCSDSEVYIQACLEAGASAFLTKVFDPQRLGHLLRHTVEFWRHAQRV
jgi:CheY-like chemotaxis protein